MDEMKTTVRTLTFSTNYAPRPPLPHKVGGHDPPAPMGAPPLREGRGGRVVMLFNFKPLLLNPVTE